MIDDIGNLLNLVCRMKVSSMAYHKIVDRRCLYIFLFCYMHPKREWLVIGEKDSP